MSMWQFLLSMCTICCGILIIWPYGAYEMRLKSVLKKISGSSVDIITLNSAASRPNTLSMDEDGITWSTDSKKYSQPSVSTNASILYM